MKFDEYLYPKKRKLKRKQKKILIMRKKKKKEKKNGKLERQYSRTTKMNYY
jgi:hypothetical protein